MKTEPTEALRELQRYDNMNTGCLLVDLDISPIVITAFKEGQSNPKVKPLEWVDEPLPPPDVTEEYYSITPFGSKINTEAETPFGICCIYENEGGAFDLWLFDDNEPIEVRFLGEAKMIAQADFERRVMECLITE